jgi:hypothetical protein
MLIGVAVVAAAWYFALPLMASIAMSIFGAMVFHTGATAKCGTYYMLGHSTCPLERSARSY